MALAQRSLGRGAVPVFVLGVTGAALFYGDADHARDLGAVRGRGLKLVTPVFDPYVVPITVAILIALFAQRHGTSKVAALFGPITAAGSSSWPSWACSTSATTWGCSPR